MSDVVRTKMGQAKHMGKWESYVAMIRLVRDLVNEKIKELVLSEYKVTVEKRT